MLAIVADDLTGALDAAAPFAGRGLHTEVALTPDAVAEAASGRPGVLSINAGSREVSAEAARRATAAVLAALPPGTRLFKKIDSRLKGNIVAELDATPFRAAMVVPAIPEFGRIVNAGYLQGFGVETPLSVAGALGPHAGRAMIPDVAAREEMDRWLDAAEEKGVDLLIGARGLAEALAARMSGRAAAQPAEIPEGPGLFVIGSRDPITLAQIDALRAAVEPRYLPAPNGRLADVAPDESPITLVQAVPGREPAAAGQVSDALAESVFPRLTVRAATLLLSGGATAEAVLQRMGITRFRLAGECLPGLGLAHARGHCIIAKSGGFGGPETLRVIADRILRKMG
ncbi:four-carbon acid sugar kinase family protein [Shinella sp. BYT-45]|uniref:four-carbon acid sugar kinase family protein n=1 Tax=Shinella sp. BYT-45 TaxID=3377377 RepID=UPI003981919A